MSFQLALMFFFGAVSFPDLHTQVSLLRMVYQRFSFEALVLQQVEYVVQYLTRELDATRHIYILMHNIDGKPFR